MKIVGGCPATFGPAGGLPAEEADLAVSPGVDRSHKADWGGFEEVGQVSLSLDSERPHQAVSSRGVEVGPGAPDGGGVTLSPPRLGHGTRPEGRVRRGMAVENDQRFPVFQGVPVVSGLGYGVNGEIQVLYVDLRHLGGLLDLEVVGAEEAEGENRGRIAGGAGQYPPPGDRRHGLLPLFYAVAIYGHCSEVVGADHRWHPAGVLRLVADEAADSRMKLSRLCGGDWSCLVGQVLPRLRGV